MKLLSSRNITGVVFDGTTSISIPFANIDGLTTTLAAKQPALTSTNTIGVFNSTQFENVSSLIQIKSTFKPTTTVLVDTTTKLATVRNIAGVSFDGTTNINIDYFGLHNKPFIQYDLQPNNLYLSPSGKV
jgi:hypothetical protein